MPIWDTRQRTGATNLPLSVSLTITGTASNGVDYTTTPSPIATLVFAAGQATRTISVIPINDSLTEGDEAVLVQIAAGTYDIVGNGYASVTIVDKPGGDKRSAVTRAGYVASEK